MKRTFKCLATSLLLISIMLCSGNSLAGGKKVLVVHSYHPELDWTIQCSRGIEAALGPDYDVEYVYLDTKRLPETAFKGKVNEAKAAFKRFKPDLVILGDDNALRLLGPDMAATGLPVVYFGINDNPRKYFDRLPENVTGVLERVPLMQWVRILTKIVPGAVKVLALMDSSPTSRALVVRNFGTAGRISDGGITVDYKMVSQWEEWQRIIHQRDRYDLIVIPLYHALRDASGSNVPYDEVIRWSSEHTFVPLFAVQDYAVGDDGVVGAYVVYGEEHGRMTGRIARSILEGVPMQDMLTPDPQQVRFYFNKKQLERFGLKLPRHIQVQAVFK